MVLILVSFLRYLLGERVRNPQIGLHASVMYICIYLKFIKILGAALAVCESAHTVNRTSKKLLLDAIFLPTVRADKISKKHQRAVLSVEFSYGKLISFLGVPML